MITKGSGDYKDSEAGIESFTCKLDKQGQVDSVQLIMADVDYNKTIKKLSFTPVNGATRYEVIVKNGEAMIKTRAIPNTRTNLWVSQKWK